MGMHLTPLWICQLMTFRVSVKSKKIIYYDYRPVARFTEYLTKILRLSYDNAKVTVDL